MGRFYWERLGSSFLCFHFPFGLVHEKNCKYDAGYLNQVVLPEGSWSSCPPATPCHRQRRRVKLPSVLPLNSVEFLSLTEGFYCIRENNFAGIVLFPSFSSLSALTNFWISCYFEVDLIPATLKKGGQLSWRGDVWACEESDDRNLFLGYSGCN